ncbi:Hsp20/alpha crystallin family protein [Neobacillus sp. NRS-1170]|uniref:Hsp20/alpha crystallin family protein n=1 Tax=Neobacillus sp. NRS-1170 TaxID=3233898 RepID=UPI003D2A2FF5
MKKRNTAQNRSIDYELVEKWMKNYFLDPLTSLCDFTQFRIDLYETDDDWIVEAVLDEYDSSEITVKMVDRRLDITAQKPTSSLSAASSPRVRTIDFPFSIIDHKVSAAFKNGVLEIFISKTEKGLGKNRYITLP